MCIDEFKGNSGKIKYQTSIADGKNKNMIDVVKSRYLKDLEEHFSKIDKEERERIRQSEQNKIGKYERLKYKRSKSLLKKERKKLK